MVGIDPTPRQQLTLLLVAGRHHLSSGDLRSLIQFLEHEDCGFDVTLQVADPVQQPELLELHRLVVTPALVKLQPLPKQVFAGSSAAAGEHLFGQRLQFDQRRSYDKPVQFKQFRLLDRVRHLERHVKAAVLMLQKLDQ